MWLILFFMAWAQAPAAPASSTLDYAVYKAKIEPLLLEKRPGHARCVVCHSTGTNFRLQPLSPGQNGAGARGRRRRVSSRRQALADPGRSGVEDDGGLGQRREMTCGARVDATKTRRHETDPYE